MVLKEVETVATGCHRLPETLHGKEGVTRPDAWGYGLAPLTRTRSNSYSGVTYAAVIPPSTTNTLPVT